MNQIIVGIFYYLLLTQTITFQYDIDASISEKRHLRHKLHHHKRAKHVNELHSNERKRHHRKSSIEAWDEIMHRNLHLNADIPVEENALFEEPGVEKKVHPNCPKCKQNSVEMSEEELTKLRIEYVKKQILEKLRLSERPNPAVIKDALPAPIAEGFTIQADQDEDDLNRRMDDFYAKTTQKIIFLTQEFEQCKIHNKYNPSVCFSFQVPQDVDVSSVESAHLWIYKKPNRELAENQTFEISEVSYWGNDKNHSKSNPLAIQETSVNEGWVKIDLEWPVKNWVQFQQLTHVIQISCKTCKLRNSDDRVPIRKENKRKPFIVIDTVPQRTLNRQRRSVNCSPSTTECCREKLHISFAEIGWGDWIIQPTGYDAYFCRGSCNGIAAQTNYAYHHTTVLGNLLRSKSDKAKKLELIPCCAATRFSSLQMMYMDETDSPVVKTLPNLIVESCGCM